MNERDLQIRELRAQGWMQSAIAERFGISQVRVSQIIAQELGPTCSKCGGPVRRDNVTGICSRNPECARESDRLLHATPEWRAKQRAWNARPEARERQRAANGTPEAKARRKAYHAAYRARPEILAREVIGRIARQGRDTDLTVDYLLGIYTGACTYRHCGKVLNRGGRNSNGDSPNLDRIVPAKGYTKGNVQWLCGTCNRRKQEMTASDMLAMLLDQLEAEGCSAAQIAQRLRQAASDCGQQRSA